jgi:hypothetical protein
MTDDGGRRTEIRRQRTEDRGQTTDDGGHRTQDGGQKGRKATDQTTEDGRQEEESFIFFWHELSYLNLYFDGCRYQALSGSKSRRPAFNSFFAIL